LLRERFGARETVLGVGPFHDVSLNWLFSFLSADKKKTYCRYRAENPEAIREAARQLNIPADVIIEVGEVPGVSEVTSWSVLR
jgi:hypothetical protein